jgi:CRP-like cAMP-binding protein
VLTSLSELLRILINKITSGGINELALYLYKLGQESGKVANGKIHIQKKVRQPEVAAALNLSREHVTRLFARLRAEKVVQFNRGFPIIDKAWVERVVKDKDLAASLRYRTSPL